MNNKRLTAMLAGVLFAAVAQQAAAAKGPEYTYAEIGYIYTDSFLVKTNGVGVNLSYGMTDHLFIKMGYSRLFLDFQTISADADADHFQIGGGAHFAITDTIDVLGALSYVDTEVTNGVPAYGDDGYLAEAGVRAMLSKSLEVNATVSSVHQDGEGDFGYGIGGVVGITRHLSLNGSVQHFRDDNDNELFLGLRMDL